jgi:hypothetical protein
MTIALGTVPAGTTIYIPFATYDGATGASEACSGLAVTDIEIYKNGSTTQRASDAGYTLLDTDGIDFDGITGINGFSIDLNDNTDAGFFAVGSWYWVVVSSITADAQTVNFIAAIFRIGPAETVAGYTQVDTAKFSGQAITCAAGVTMLANVGFAGAPGANNGPATTNGTKVNQTVDLTAAQSIACSDKTGFSLAATGADLILKTSTFAQALVAAINEFATYGLTALNTLLVTTGIKAATIPAATLAANQHVIVDSGTVTAIPNATVGGYAAGQDPVTLMNAAPPDVNVKTETNHDFTALQKTSLNAATPAVSVSNGGIQALSFAANALNAAAIDADVGTELSAANWSAAARTLTSAASFQVKKNTQLTAFPFVITDAVTHAPLAGLVVTAVRSIDGGAFGACANAVVEIANGWYKITLAAADLNGTTIALRFTAAGADDLNLTLITQA